MQFIVNTINGTFEMIKDFIWGGFEKGWEFLLKHKIVTYTILLLFLIIPLLFK